MDEVSLVEYDSRWPSQFQQERRHLLDVMAGEAILGIENFGSTAIPGLIAKPIIDILIAVPDVTEARAAFVDRLSEIDYVFWADNPKQDRLFFVKGMPPYGAQRTHHVHVAERPSEMWSRLKFRDYLIAHDSERTEYAALKRDLAHRFAHDREAYTAAKGEFVDRVMRLAD